MPRMHLIRTASVVLVGGLVFLLASGSPAATRSGQSRRVVVEGVGWGQGDGRHSYGAKVVNRSKKDAFGVTVTIDTYVGGGLEKSEHFPIDEIPAAESFVVADSPRGVLGSHHLTHEVAHLRVQQMLRHGSGEKLSTVSDVQIDRSHFRVRAVMSNPYPFRVNLNGWRAYALLYDAAGRIIGGGKNYRLPRVRLKAGGHTRIAIYTPAPMSRATRAEVSVTTP
jgi:hypothetical protein